MIDEKLMLIGSLSFAFSPWSSSVNVYAPVGQLRGLYVPIPFTVMPVWINR
jgi:hypothetical protein